jgi:hypothetical protein
MQYLDDQWNRPDRSDKYQMQTAMEVKRVLAKDPASITLDQFQIKFVKPPPEPVYDEGEEIEDQPITEEEKSWIAIAKARWLGFLNIKKD